MDSNINVKVAVRCRPMSRKEIDRGCNNIVDVQNNVLTIRGTEGTKEDKTFTFDYVYDGAVAQNKVYTDLGRPVVNQALEGFNGTIFAYGQTGSGKTFSMMGTDENKGIIPLLNDELWVRIQERIASIETKITSSDGKVTSQFFVTVSFLEVYNEDIKDLLNPSDKKLKIHESPDLGIYVEDLAELVVKDASDVIRLIYQGNAVRHVGATQMNDQSSRSHSVFTIKVEQRITTDLSASRQREQLIKAKVNLVDLAGSERASKTNATGQTLKEGANINKSLMTLGNVINQLSEGVRKGKVIPYRESKLTRLLQESLGGNAATIMIASISPADYNYSETVSTLKYANRAKSIENAVVRNEDSSERMIKDLQDQIEALKAQLMNAAQGGSHSSPELEAKLKEMEKSQMSVWEEKERLSQQLEAERAQNVNNVISQMMQSVKEQKVLHMKNIKRLTNEKNLLSKNYKDMKEGNVAIKQSLDTCIARYQELQSQYDASASSLAEEMKVHEHDKVAMDKLRVQEQQNETLANEMYSLLTKIEQDRIVYGEKRDELNKLKKRLEKIDVEITEERAELVATAGVLQQNDKIREQIKEEERLKMQVEFEKELNVAKMKLEEERLVVRENIQSELEGEMEKLRSEIKMLKSLLKIEESKNLEWSDHCRQLQEYSEQLEQKLADSEVAQESTQEELERIRKELREKSNENQSLKAESQTLQDDIVNLNKDLANNIEKSKEVTQRLVEEARFDMFKKMMDGFQEERKVLEQKYLSTQNLLAQATKDIMHLAKRNQDLESELHKAIYYEPTIT